MYANNSQSTSAVNALLDAALQYAGRGWHVLPLVWIEGGWCSCGDPKCASPGKHPRIRGGLKSASSDRQQVERWWRRWPKANIGIRTGQVSNLVVVDVDGPAAKVEMGRLMTLYGALPKTAAVKTGRPDGYHLYFSGNVVCGSSKADGIEVKGEDAYVVAPPSNHLSGNTYAWLRAPR